MTDEIIIKAEHITKEYCLGAIGGRTLKREIQSSWASFRGKEDPNLKLEQSGHDRNERFFALDDVSFSVKKGEALGIIGLNGAGKSTLLKLLCRITSPSSGTIMYNGRIASMLEIGTGFHPELTGRENIYMNGAILGMSRAEITRKFDRIVDFAGMEKFIDTPVKRYSSGMYVKLAFSVAAHLDAEIMVMDEVLAVGDAAFQKKCIEKMREVSHTENRTILYVSHNMNTIRSLCDRCMILDLGKKIFEGGVEEAVSAYMNRGAAGSAVNIDLRGKSVAHSKIHGLSMLCLSLHDKTDPIYKKGDVLKIRLELLLEKPVRNVCFRLSVRSDADMGLGTVWSERHDIIKTGISEVFISLPLDYYETGVYFGSIGCYEIDENGNEIILDHVSSAFRFEIEGTPAWSRASFGMIELSGLSVEIISG